MKGSNPLFDNQPRKSSGGGTGGGGEFKRDPNSNFNLEEKSKKKPARPKKSWWQKNFEQKV
jgi:hypothetical protein